MNSGAYVAEIFRSGIMSVDKGQMEAGRSLGLGYTDTMLQIIMPQAIKNCLPALVNEMITLLKETSICGYIGLNGLTRGEYYPWCNIRCYDAIINRSSNLPCNCHVLYMAYGQTGKEIERK